VVAVVAEAPRLWWFGGLGSHVITASCCVGASGSPACSPAWHIRPTPAGRTPMLGAPDMNRGAGRGRVLRPAARSLRANASVRRPGRSHGRCLGSPPSWVRGRAARLDGGAGGERLQAVVCEGTPWMSEGFPPSGARHLRRSQDDLDVHTI